ncbi:similar to An12g08390 [Aspergillus niger]|uniref:Similar to An12g08390 n=1 Tax=Aspergillus niger TaxID=5061 RepID=A0A100IQT0_ASPNG|nr:similar to An12g08390 [Aspergillus niger]
MPPFGRIPINLSRPQEPQYNPVASRNVYYDPFLGYAPNPSDDTVCIPFATNRLTPVPVQPGRLEQPGASSTLLTSSSIPVMNIGNNKPGPYVNLASYPNPISRAAPSNEVPYGSLVRYMEAPTWGVIKISNIPYSITKQEIFQFVGRQARLVAGHAVHIIMERPTAKTMDCFVEFASTEDAEETANRINRIYECGRAPRLGNRHVEVEISNQEDLLKDLFPRAKCISWENGTPKAVENTDRYSTGFTGFFTSEEIIGAIRHAEMPQRSPFGAKCPQRTYESTISTLYKFPWYATDMYTVHDRNQLFELTNRHIRSLVSRMEKSKTVGLDHRLLRELLYAGLNCPAFNERQKYTLCIHAGEKSEILKLGDMSKWFPFDTLVYLPGFDYDTCALYASVIANGRFEGACREFPNNFPAGNTTLISPFGRIWFEWPTDVAKNTLWVDAVNRETNVLNCLLQSGSMGTIHRPLSMASTSSSVSPTSPITDESVPRNENVSRVSVLQASSRRASECWNSGSGSALLDTEGIWGQKVFFSPPKKFRAPSHRITHSSPNCLKDLNQYCLT